MVNPSPWGEVVVLRYSMQDCKQERKQLDNLPHTLVEEVVAVMDYSRLECKLEHMKEHSSFRMRVQLALLLVVVVVVVHNKRGRMSGHTKLHSLHHTWV